MGSADSTFCLFFVLSWMAVPPINICVYAGFPRGILSQPTPILLHWGFAYLYLVLAGWWVGGCGVGVWVSVPPFFCTHKSFPAFTLPVVLGTALWCVGPNPFSTIPALRNQNIAPRCCVGVSTCVAWSREHPTRNNPHSTR